MKKIIMHIDVNNAFLSWTALDLLKKGYKYDIRNSYAVIGGDPKKRAGIVLAKSNLCKKLGINTAETLYSAKKKCSILKVYPPNYYLYQKMSNNLFSFLHKYTPDIEVFSIDECFIDYSKVKNLYGDELLFAQKIKEKIKKELGFTVNIGIGNNKLSAKMASDLEKPDKINTLYEEEIKSKMWPLTIDKLFGVGKKSCVILNKIGILTIGDLAKADVYKLSKIFKNQALKMIESANGIDQSIVNSEEVCSKCISVSTTLPHDYFDKEDIYIEMDRLVERVTISLREQKLNAYVIAIIIKNSFFKTSNHQITLKNATNSTIEIKKITKKLFNDIWNGEAVRLIGVRLGKLTTNNSYQLSLFEDINKRENDLELDAIIDNINKKYGKETIKIVKLK